MDNGLFEQDPYFNEGNSNRGKKIIITIIAIVAVIAIAVVLFINLVVPNMRYDYAVELMANGGYEEAKNLLVNLNGFANSEGKIAIIDTIMDLNEKELRSDLSKIFENGETVTFEFDLQGGTGIEEGPFKISSMEEFDALPTPQKTGYKLQGWSITGSSYSEESSLCIKRMVLWTDTYSITYNLNGGEVSHNPSQYNKDSDKDIILNNPSRYGYRFTGWSGTGIDGKSNNVTIPAGSYGDRTYTANFDPNEYVIHLDATSGVLNTNTLNVKYGDTFTLPIPTKENYTFVGWYQGSEKYTYNTLQDAESVSLKAKWTLTDYKISYNLDGGTNPSTNPSSFNVQSADITLANPQKSGYTFLGWYSDPSFTNKVRNIPSGSSENISLYAKWELATYTISYVLNGGTVSGARTTSFTIDDLPISLPSISKSGYTFDGWYIGNTAVGTSGITQAENTTVTAKWSAITYKITYNLNGGTNSSKNPSSYSASSSYITLSAPTRSGYVFGGWYSDSSFKTKVTGISTSSLKNITLYAKWDLTTYTIDYILGGGVISGTKTTTFTVHDLPLTLPSNVTRAGSTFNGWRTGGASGTLITTITEAKNIAVFASYVDSNLEFKLYNSYSSSKYYAVTNYAGKSERVDIPGDYKGVPVTNISAGAFADNTYVKTITMGDNITSISSNAFKNCRGLSSITFSKNLESIGSDAFYGCSGLINVTLPDSITSIKSAAFKNCYALQNVNIPTSLTSLGFEAFQNCVSISKITIPSGVKTLEQGTFRGCISLSSVTLSEGLTTIKANVFSTDALYKLIIPSTVTTISSSAFKNGYVSSYSDDLEAPDCNNVYFYCRSSFEPSGFGSNWNNNCRVHWGYTGN